MRGHISTISGSGGDGDAPSYHNGYKSSSDNDPHRETEAKDNFAVNYGNYGDPHSFIPYQLILLLIDFVFNWTMDLVHEFPLAVLVIFVFQSLALIVNFILYIMASASQAMQVGVQKRVTIHHWLNLIISLSYMILTGWWFIWALRKSWPSVSDQFSFTWRTEDIITTTVAPPLRANNAIRNSTGVEPNKEHIFLWTPGFNSVYIIHRTLAIIHYFIYFRATFLVLNSQKIDKFIEMKNELSRKLLEQRKNESDRNKKRKRLRGRGGGDFSSFPANSKTQLGLDEYLSGNPFSLGSEDRMEKPNERKSKKKPMSVLWADENDGKELSQSREDDVNYEDESVLPSKERRGKENQRETEESDGIVPFDEGQDEDGSEDESKEERSRLSALPPKPMPRPHWNDNRRRKSVKSMADVEEEYE